MRVDPVPNSSPRGEVGWTGVRLVPVSWREGMLTWAKEFESMCAWVLANRPRASSLTRGISCHLEAARQGAARQAPDAAPSGHYERGTAYGRELARRRPLVLHGAAAEDQDRS